LTRKLLCFSFFFPRDGKPLPPLQNPLRSNCSLYRTTTPTLHSYPTSSNSNPPQIDFTQQTTLFSPPRHNPNMSSTTTRRTNLFVSVLALLALAPSSVFAIGDFPCAGSSDAQSCLAWSTDGEAQGEISADAVCQPGKFSPLSFSPC